MTPDDIRDLFRFKGGHAMARMAARPDLTISGWKQSIHGLYAWPERVDTEKNGIRFTNAETGDSRLITWHAIRAHALEHTTDETRAWINTIDGEWCHAVTGTPGHPPARAVTCERWLDALAREVWDPDLAAPDTPEPEQLDMLTYLEEMSS